MHRYYHLVGPNGLATSDAAWAALLQPGAAPGLKFVTTAVSMARDDPKCFPLREEGSDSCRGLFDKVPPLGAGSETKLGRCNMCSRSPSVRFTTRFFRCASRAHKVDLRVEPSA